MRDPQFHFVLGKRVFADVIGVEFEDVSSSLNDIDNQFFSKSIFLERIDFLGLSDRLRDLTFWARNCYPRWH